MQADLVAIFEFKVLIFCQIKLFFYNTPTVLDFTKSKCYNVGLIFKETDE